MTTKRRLKAFSTFAVVVAMMTFAPAVASAAPASTLVSSDDGGASIIQWGGSGNKLAGTFDSFSLQNDTTAPTNSYSTESDHCAIAGHIAGSTINITLSGCSKSATDGVYVAHQQGSLFEFTFPSSTGSLTTVVFKSGTINTYNAAVSSIELLVNQDNALETYISGAQPAETYFSPSFTEPFKVGSTWFDIGTQQTNSAPDHVQSNVAAFVLKWFDSSGSGYWIEWKRLGIDGYEPPAAPTVLRLGTGITAYGIEQGWMNVETYNVIAYIGGHWQLLPFSKDTKLKKSFYGPQSWKVNGQNLIESVQYCTTQTNCKTAKITYTFQSTAKSGPVFAVTSLGGYAGAYVTKK